MRSSLWGSWCGVWLCVGCGPGAAGEDVTAAADPDEGQSFSAEVTALDGGVLASASGGATLTLTRGDLGVDTSLTLEVLPPVAGSVAPVYRFGPDGLVFRNPAELTITVTDPAVSAEDAVLAWIDEDGSFVPVDGVGSNGAVTGTVRHFTEFTLIPRDGLSTSAFFRLHHFATITNYATLSMDVTFNGVTTTVATDQAWEAGGEPVEVSVEQPSGPPGGVVTVSIKDANGAEVDGFDLPVQAGKQYGVVAVTDDLELDVPDRGIRHDVLEFPIVDMEQRYDSTDPYTILHFVVDGSDPIPPIVAWERSGGAWAGPAPLPLGQVTFADLASKLGDIALNVEGAGAAPGQAILCGDFRAPGGLTEPVMYVFVATDTPSESASDAQITFDLLNGTVEARDPDMSLCP